LRRSRRVPYKQPAETWQTTEHDAGDDGSIIGLHGNQRQEDGDAETARSMRGQA
jgi:hypothetical protein